MFDLPNKPFIVAPLSQVDCVSFTTFFSYHGHDLVELEEIFTALIVAPMKSSSRFTHRARHKANLLRLFLIKISMPTPFQDNISFLLIPRVSPLFFLGPALRRVLLASSSSHIVKQRSASVLENFLAFHCSRFESHLPYWKLHLSPQASPW